jgi:predicted nucleic acid-binding protein
VNVLVDTSVWSLALRRAAGPDRSVAGVLSALIQAHRVRIIGPIRQEILSGIRDADQFAKLASHLAAFPDLPLETADFVEAASFFNLCRTRGVQGSNTDFLICAVAVREKLAIYTTDRDFQAFAKILPISLLAG